MEQVNAYQLFFPVFSLILNVVPLVTTVRKKYAQAARVEDEVGKLGVLYSFISKSPRFILGIMLLIVCLWSVATITVGVIHYNNIDQPEYVKNMLQNAHWILVATVILLVLVVWDILPRVLVWISGGLNYCRFKPAWITANGQFRSDGESYAVNINHETCQRVALSVFEQMRTQSAAELPTQAPRPEGLDKDELANYLLFGCAIESHIHYFYSGKPEKLSEMWEYLDWAARNSRRPFQPTVIMNHFKQTQSLYRTLHDLAADCPLPKAAPIFDTVDKIVQRLAKRYKGDASRLAVGRLLRQPSPRVLLKRLREFDRYKRSESLRRLFLKLGVRMDVWSCMDPGPFLFPYYSGIALLLLNSECILVSSKRMNIVADDEFRALVAETEERIIKDCYSTLGRTAEDSETIRFCKTVFDCELAEIPPWRFFHYVDLWLFNHTHQFCMPKSMDATTSSSCPLIVRDNICYCEAASTRWRVRVDSLVRELQT